MENLPTKLDECNSLPEIFELVKQSVKKFLNKQRAGLMLGLADLETDKAISSVPSTPEALTF